MNINRKRSQTRITTVAVSSITLMFSMSAFARLDGAIFTTTPLGDIVNENVRYESKEHVFLDGGPGANAPRTAAALPAGLYYFQVTDPAGKCLLSSTLEGADINGGTCYEDVKIKGNSAKNADSFYAEPLACRLFYFDGEGGVTFMNDSVTITQEVKYRGQMVTESIDIECRHQLGSEYLDIDPTQMPDGDTIQLFPFANTSNSGGVYKAWVSTAESVEAACEGTDLYGAETGENCDGFFGFIPRFSKTDNFKALTPIIPPNFDIALRSFHDKNLNCQYDPMIDEVINRWELGIRHLDDNMGGGVMRSTKLTNDSPDEPVNFSVYDVHNDLWSVDQFMWWASDYEVPIMNTPFTHLTTFAELRDFEPTFEDGVLHIGFENALACQSDGTIKLSVDEDVSFVPGNWAEPVYGDEPDPVLTVRFGSFGFAKLEVCKSFDRNGNGMHDEDEPLIPGWPVELYIPESVPIPDNYGPGNPDFDQMNMLVQKNLGESLAPVINRYVKDTTDEQGCVSFNVLVPNVVPDDLGALPSYQVSEDVVNLHPAWMSTSAYEVTFDVESVLSYVNNAPVLEGVLRNRSDGKDDSPVYFNNVCKVTVDFDTKGYWHNKNGLQELTEADRTYVNGLAPYSSPSPYFGAGDEPFDGRFTDGSDVAAAFSDGSMVWAAGTWQSEVSQFLVDNNGNSDLYDHKEQLAQQLLAFIFNTRHRPDASGLTPEARLWVGGEWVSIEELITRAISAWQGSDDGEIVSIKDLLDWLNNNNEIKVLVSSPDDCPPPYSN